MAIRSFEIDPDAVPTGEDVRDALLALADEDRGVIVTRPVSGQVPIVALNGNPSGQKVKLQVEFDDQPIP